MRASYYRHWRACSLSLLVIRHILLYREIPLIIIRKTSGFETRRISVLDHLSVCISRNGQIQASVSDWRIVWHYFAISTWGKVHMHVFRDLLTVSWNCAVCYDRTSWDVNLLQSLLQHDDAG